MFHIHFILAGLVTISIITVHLFHNNRLEDKNSLAYRNLLLAVFFEVGFDLISSVAANYFTPRYNWFALLSTSALYLLDIILCYYMLYYVESLWAGETHRRRRLTRYVAAVPVAITILLLLVNIWEPLLFYYDAQGIYRHGICYYSNYFFCLLYIVYCTAELFFYHRSYSRRNLFFLLEALIVIALCVGLQFVFSDVMLISFGICQALLTLYLNINNPTHYLDAVTGALDESYFDRWIKEQIAEDRYIYLAAVDLVNLREISQIYGPEAANRVLHQVAQGLRPFSHEEDLVRLGSTTLVLHAHSQEEHTQQLNNIAQWLCSYTADRENCLTLRVAVTGIPSAEAILADYPLKDYIDYLFSGQTFVQPFTLVQAGRDQHEGFAKEKAIEQYLRRAVEEDLFSLAFQPIYGIREQRFVTMEVLSRLQHPIYGAISPQHFINIAERTGMVTDITVLQFRRLCRVLKEEPDLLDRLERVKFNLSAIDLAGTGTVKKLLEILKEAGLPGSKFEFEVTESMATRFNYELQQAIELLAGQDITLSLDDFGSGYANLNAVMRLPFHSVKMDISLLNGVEQDAAKATFYQSLVRTMKTAGYLIISEGVETEAQASLLAEWGVDNIQGYYFARPVPQQSLRETLESPLHTLPSHM